MSVTTKLFILLPLARKVSSNCHAPRRDHLLALHFFKTQRQNDIEIKLSVLKVGQEQKGKSEARAAQENAENCVEKVPKNNCGNCF